MRISDWSSDVCSSDLQNAARFLDAVIDTVVGAARAPLCREHQAGYDWPDVRTAHSTRTLPTTVWRAPDRTPVITAAAALPNGGTVMTTVNARDITQTVRIERYRLSVGLGNVTLVPGQDRKSTRLNSSH